MALNERQNEILKILKDEKRADVQTLAKRLYVSEATIRRDLNEMKSIGLVERNHGGAILPENSEEISLFFRIEKNASEKERAATKALPHVPFFKSVFIDNSTTALALAERMDLSFKTVITNGLETAVQLSKKPNVTVLQLGGTVQSSANATSGLWTAKQIENFSFDLMISSCSAVQGGVAHERSLDTRELKFAAFSHSKQRLLIIDHTKFEAHGTYRLAKLSEYDLVATDLTPPKELLDGSIKFIY